MRVKQKDGVKLKISSLIFLKNSIYSSGLVIRGETFLTQYPEHGKSGANFGGSRDCRFLPSR